MLCVTIYPTCIVMADRSGGQHVRLFFNRFDMPPPNAEFTGLLGVPYISVLRLLISEKYRRMGYGTLALALMRESNPEVKSYIVNAEPDNIEEISRQDLYGFYSRFGFTEYRKNEDGMIMLANF